MNYSRNESLFGGDADRRRQATEIIKKQLKKNDFIPFKQGRPNRPVGKDGNIRTDDILNLIIAFNTAKGLDDFLTMV